MMVSGRTIATPSRSPGEDFGEGGDGPPVARLEARTRCASLKHDDLLAEHCILRHELGVSAEGIAHQAEEGSEELRKHRQEP